MTNAGNSATPEGDSLPPPEPAEPSSEFTVAVTPVQLAAGAAILAALVLIVVRRLRGRRP